MNAIDRTLVQYGADLEFLLRFGESSADLLPYATLTGTRRTDDGDLAALHGVYEWQGSPLVFLVDGSVLRDEQHLRAIRRRLAMRGDAPYLGVVRPGQLVIHRIGLDAEAAERSRLGQDVLPRTTQATFAHLGNHRPGLIAKRRWIADVVLKLLDEAISTLIGEGVSGDDAISLVGRALFTRFLGDRHLLPALFSADGQAERLFDTPAQAEEISDWLDLTFNGDLLLLSSGLFQNLSVATYKVLGNILRHAPGGQRNLEWQEDWAHLDFAHIPVGVLSQAYEHYQRRHSSDSQRKEGGYYTPRLIADLMVRGAFHALRREGLAHAAKVLDPAAGAGVFMLTAFRLLVAERWRHDGNRPETQTLRDILYDQMAGFDINEAGLRFAALGLYLLSIELDPNPEPVQKLGFKNLRDRVLFKVGEQGGLGSLGDGVGEEHRGRYDLVVGNPPWSSSTGLADWSLVKKNVEKIARGRLPENGPAPRLPNEVMDLPFVWRAMEWAKPNGQIAFALHARLLFLQGDGMPEARAALFSALDVTGIVNGAEVRQSKVWPEIDAPFCLLYARNRPPQAGAGFRFVNPHLEDGLNNTGGLRIDANNAVVVATEQVVRQPEILKILFRGGPLGLEVFERMAMRGLGTLDNYWRARFGTHRGKLRYAGNGYQKLRKSSRIRKNGDGLPGVSADYLEDLPELTELAAQAVRLDPQSLGEFRQVRIHDKRPRDIFLGPLLIVRESPPANAGRIRVVVSDQDVVFNQSYHGFSTRVHSDSGLLVRYLALLIASKPALWFALMTSGRFGFEREVVEKKVIDSIPVPPFEQLSPASREQIAPLFDIVASQDDEASWARVDAWVAELYGLNRHDLEAIDDILRFNLPFADNRNAAQATPTASQLEAFRVALDAELQPWATRLGKKLCVSVCGADQLRNTNSPWGLVQIETSKTTSRLSFDDWPEVLRVADHLASTEVLHPDPEGSGLWIARLAQARYWSLSAARLLARRIIWEQAEVLFGRTPA